MGSAPTGVFEAVRKRPWVSLFALLVFLSALLLIVLRSNIGFFLDDWALVLEREGGASDWLLPHNEHIIVLPAAIYKLSLAVFGMTAMPLHLLAVALFLTSVVLLFCWLRTLVGDPAAVIGCALVLFLGAAVEDLIWAFQIGYFGSMASGLGALLLLRRNDLRGDLWACLLLVVSLLCSSMVIPLALAAAVQILLREGSGPDWQGLWRRCWVFAAPGLLFVIWWLGWGQLAQSYLSLGNAAKAPLYVLSSLGYAGAILTGTFPLREVSSSFLWAIPGVAVALALVRVLRRPGPVPPEFLVAAAAAVGFWALSALNYIPGREFTASRYAYPTTILMLMMLGGAFAGSRPGPRLLKAIGVLAAFALTVNLAVLIYATGDRYKPIEEKNRISFTAFDLTERTVDPDFWVGISTDDKAPVFAGDYFRAVHRYGSPAMSLDEVEQASGKDRIRLDQLLVAALPVSYAPTRRLLAGRAGCRSLTAGRDVDETLELHTRRLLIDPGQTVVIRLGRFGPGAGAIAGVARPGQPIEYTIPADRSDRPWRIGFQGSGEVKVCPVSASGETGAQALR